MTTPHQTAANDDLAELVFELSERQRPRGGPTESLWAAYMDDSAFRVLNTPFHITGVSLHDVVAARPLPGGDGRFEFENVLAKSGNSTYRVFTYPETRAEEFLSVWESLEELGCSAEQAPGDLTSLYAIHVPRHVDIQQALVLLREGQINGAWDFEQGDCGHVL